MIKYKRIRSYFVCSLYLKHSNKSVLDIFYSQYRCWKIARNDNKGLEYCTIGLKQRQGLRELTPIQKVPLLVKCCPNSIVCYGKVSCEKKSQFVTEIVDSGCSPLKNNNRLDWWIEKLALFQMPATGGERVADIYPRVDSCPSPAPPPNTSTGNLWARGLRGTTYRNSIVIFSPHSHLQIGQQWSDQRHLGCFRYSWSSVPGPICSHFLAASPQELLGSSWSADVWSSCS